MKSILYTILFFFLVNFSYTQCLSGDCNNGYGVFKYDNGTYEGYFQDSKRTGKGTYNWNNGYKYIGDFIENKRTGKGKYYLSEEYTGHIYEGDFNDNHATGQGKYIYPNGDQFEGSFVDMKFNGWGTYFYFDLNRKFIGNWVNSKRTGIGRYLFSDGDYSDEAYYENDEFKYYIPNSTTSNSTTTSNTNNQTSTSNNQVTNSQSNPYQNSSSNIESTNSCEMKISRITGITYSLYDDRKLCCYCEKQNGKYSLNTDYEKNEEILLLAELLYLHLLNASEDHKKNDIERCKNFISENFDVWSAALFPLQFSLMQLHFLESSIKGGNFGKKNRKVNKYKLENKFCTNACESQCNYYKCKCD